VDRLDVEFDARRRWRRRMKLPTDQRDCAASWIFSAAGQFHPSSVGYVTELQFLLCAITWRIFARRLNFFNKWPIPCRFFVPQSRLPQMLLKRSRTNTLREAASLQHNVVPIICQRDGRHRIGPCHQRKQGPIRC